jgi:primary-amine oxidase
MVYLSFSDDLDTCHYAAPLPLVPVISADDFTLVDIEYTPIWGTGDRNILDLEGRFPWEHYTANEYDAGIRKAAGLSFREDVKPYRVIQPEGASVSRIFLPNILTERLV